MKASFKKTVRVTVSSLLILFGLCGLILPFINGILFLVAGLLILSLESPTLEAWLDRYGRKYTRLEKWYDKCKNFIQKYF